MLRGGPFGVARGDDDRGDRVLLFGGHASTFALPARTDNA